MAQAKQSTQKRAPAQRRSKRRDTKATTPPSTNDRDVAKANASAGSAASKGAKADKGKARSSEPKPPASQKRSSRQPKDKTAAPSPSITAPESLPAKAGDSTSSSKEADTKTANNTAPPKGKLGALLRAVEGEAGATTSELSSALGWQAHTTRAAITRLRQRGFEIALSEKDGRRAYRLQSGV